MEKYKFKTKRILPNFFGIGVKRGGTSWIYEILKTHPEIYLCPYQKETHFFSKFYYKGLNWYSRFFPKLKYINDYKYIGEITPTYIFYKHVPILISKYFPSAKFIVILRNPVDRLISEYKYERINPDIFKKGYYIKQLNKISIFNYIKEYPDTFKRGLYSEQLKHWMKFFPKENFLILIFEELLNQKVNGLKTIANFLNISFNGFNQKLINKKVNPSDYTRFTILFHTYNRFHRFFLLKDLQKYSKIEFHMNKILKISKIRRNFNVKKNKELIKEMNLEKIKSKLLIKYKKEINELEKFLKRKFTIWKA